MCSTERTSRASEDRFRVAAAAGAALFAAAPDAANFSYQDVPYQDLPGAKFLGPSRILNIRPRKHELPDSELLAPKNSGNNQSATNNINNENQARDTPRK